MPPWSRRPWAAISSWPAVQIASGCRARAQRRGRWPVGRTLPDGSDRCPGPAGGRAGPPDPTCRRGTVGRAAPPTGRWSESTVWRRRWRTAGQRSSGECAPIWAAVLRPRHLRAGAAGASVALRASSRSAAPARRRRAAAPGHHWPRPIYDASTGARCDTRQYRLVVAPDRLILTTGPPGVRPCRRHPADSTVRSHRPRSRDASAGSRAASPRRAAGFCGGPANPDTIPPS